MNITDIAAEGDVIFKLQLTRLRVSSVILASASPVFKAMLGRNFLEGHGVRSAQYPKEIPLPEDDSMAMARLCSWFHHKEAPDGVECLNLSTVCGAEGFFAIAGLADKYGCMAFFKVMSAPLLTNFAHIPGTKLAPIEAIMHLIAASFIMDDSRQFYRLTRYLVMDYGTAYSEQLQHAALASLPSSFLRETPSNHEQG